MHGMYVIYTAYIQFVINLQYHTLKVGTMEKIHPMVKISYSYLLYMHGG